MNAGRFVDQQRFQFTPPIHSNTPDSHPSKCSLHIGYTLPDSTNENDLKTNDSKITTTMNAHANTINTAFGIPQPNLMPRPTSINGRTGIMPSPRGNNGGNFTRSNLSAFSSPNYKVLTSGVSSPAPSVIASDCSLPSRTPSSNFNEFDQSSLAYEHWGAGGGIKPTIQISPRSNQAHSVTRKTSHDYYHFSPIHTEQSEGNSYAFSYQQSNDRDTTSGFVTPSTIPETFYPQCQEVPRSISMTKNEPSINAAVPSYPSCNDGKTANNSNSFHMTTYCVPCGSELHLKRPASYVQIQELHSQPQLRTRKTSTDSVDSNTTLFRSISSDESTGSIPQLPQNLKGDPHRQAKVKTELCLHYAKGNVCPFGTRCNYAHGEHELKYTKLFELQKAGLVENISSYRSHPCASWVSTGSCPFGLRCHNLHDPRIASKYPSWLPHSDIPVSSIQTDLTVDKSYHQEQAILSQENPLVHDLLWAHRPSQKKVVHGNRSDEVGSDAESEWKDTYSLVCNMANLYKWKKSPGKGSPILNRKISELEKLCIALKMSYSSNSIPTHLNFVYKAKHIVYDELCMVLQTKYFLLLRPSHVDIAGELPIHSIVREITVKEYEGRKSAWNKKYPYSPNDVVSVRELTFGCLGEPSSKVSLWFDLPDPDLLSNQEIKRFKRNRQRKLQDTSHHDASAKPSPFPGMKYITDSINKAFESHPQKPFFHMRPVSNDVTNLCLIKDILKHRILILLRRKFDRNMLDSIKNQGIESGLGIRFQRIKKAMLRWQWPVNKGREVIGENTPVPSCGTKYKPSNGTHVNKIWETFLMSGKNHVSDRGNDKKYNSRLSIFCSLSEGASIPCVKDQTLMHVKSNYSDEDISKNEIWKYVSGAGKSEWNLIKEHYLSGNEHSNKDGNMPLSCPQGEKLRGE